LILGEVNQRFVNDVFINGNMVRRDKTHVQTFEVQYLLYCLSDETQKLLYRFQDTELVGLPYDCGEFNCSINTLGHLFYAAKVLEQCKNKNLETIVEFGAGYGNLARIFKKVLPDTTLVLIDLPEMLALQYFFLTSTLADVRVIMHTTPPAEYEKGAIHLVPPYDIEDMQCRADLFISTFALSESSAQIQELVISKNFFNAPVCYIVGQLEGWGPEFNFVHHSFLHDSIRSVYSSVQCQPYHMVLNDLKSYEIIGCMHQ
jgi:putative sugar O-methyltransferase